MAGFSIDPLFSNQIACNCDRFGKFLMHPTHFQIDQLAKVICPLKPGHRDQQDNTWKEVAVRVFRIVLCTALITTLPLALIGIGLQNLAFYSSREFVLINPNNQPPTGNPTIKELKICTFNAYLMPAWIRLFVHNYTHPQERVEAAAQGAVDSDVDILCVQEMFDYKAAFQFMESIKEKYPYMVYHAGPSYIKLGSGLFIASKFPIENPQYWEHAEKIGTERLSSKGTIAATVRLNDNQRIPIFNTHLEAGLDDAAQAVPCRVSQLQDIQKHLQEYCNGFDRYFLCGDMNISSKNDAADLEKLKEIMTIDMQDAARKQGTFHKTLPTVHASQEEACNCSHSVERTQDIDYIGIPKAVEANAKLISSHLECFNGASDHMAYVATYDLTS
jgi:exonuclease III